MNCYLNPWLPFEGLMFATKLPLISFNPGIGTKPFFLHEAGRCKKHKCDMLCF